MKINGVKVTAEQVDAWLSSKGVSLWADFSLNEGDDQEAAVAWFMDQIEKLSEFAKR